MVGKYAIAKQNEFGFNLVKFDILGNFFAFPLHVDHILFVDDLNNLGWKVVIRK